MRSVQVHLFAHWMVHSPGAPRGEKGGVHTTRPVTSTDAEDTKTLVEGSSREQRAAAVRRVEKVTHRNTVLILEEEMGSLEEKEYYQERRLRMLNLDRPVDEV